MSNNYKNDATMFVYWCKNWRGDYREIFHEIFGKVMGDHFANKLTGYLGRDKGCGEVAWLNLYCEMTDDNREKLLSWLRENNW